jgi:hypothetical protein
MDSWYTTGPELSKSVYGLYTVRGSVFVSLLSQMEAEQVYVPGLDKPVRIRS